MVNDNMILEDVFIAPGSFRNFSGKEGPFNKTGERQFSVFLPTDVADILREQGWYVKHKPATREGYEDREQLDIAVGFEYYPPVAKLVSYDGKETYLNEESIGLLDSVDIDRANVEIRPHNWNVNGKTGVKAWLAEITVWAKAPRRGLNARLRPREEEDEDEF